MGNLLRREACPRCQSNGKHRSGDNLAVYSDHVYCYSCGYYHKSVGNRIIGEKIRSSQSTNVSVRHTDDLKKRIHLPYDFTVSLPRSASDWLAKYELTRKEIAQHRIGWSDHGFTMTGRGSNPTPVRFSPCMVFPIYSTTGELLMWQARYFGSQPGFPKWFTKGNPNDILHVLGEKEHGKDGPVVLVEDLISSIKVSRFSRSMCLFGSDLRLSVVNRLTLITDNIILWLDHDKTKESHRFSRVYSSRFVSFRVVSSLKDPKEVPSEEIRGLVS